MSCRSRSVPLLWSVVVVGSIALGACGGAARVDVASNAAGAAGQAASAGSGNSCANIDCLAVECKSDQMRVRHSGDCCDTCVTGDSAAVGGASSVGGAAGVLGAATAGSGGLDCAGVPCPGSVCGPDEFFETVPGSCCSQCKAQTPECKKGQAGYQQLFTAFMQQAGVTSCVTDEDCTVLPGPGNCASSCGGGPFVNVTAASEFEAELSKLDCSTCKLIALPCPPPSLSRPACVDGMCAPAPLR